MKKKLWVLFLSTFYLSAFTFGGGYVIISLMKKRFVDELHWIEEEEMMDLLAIAQSAPGAIAINGAIAIGYKIAGWAGVIISILGTALPPLILLSIISFFYASFIENQMIRTLLFGMQAGVCALICSVVIDMAMNMEKSKESYLILCLSFILNVFLNIPVPYIMTVCILYALFLYRKERVS